MQIHIISFGVVTGMHYILSRGHNVIIGTAQLGNGWGLECRKVNFLYGVPWPGNFWMLFTFQPALQVLQQPHKHSQ